MRWLVLVAAAVALAGCGGQSPSVSPGLPAATTSAPTSTPSAPLTTPAAPSSTRAPKPAPTPAPGASESADPRWRFYTDDHAWHTSPWFDGSHRVMIGFGCNTAPWYSHDPRCPGREGFHHGIDVAMPCGTPLHSGVDGTVLDPSAPGAPGSAYGVHPFRIRTGDHDILIGHTIHVFVAPGEHVHVGQRIALAGDSGAPDGCHLHFEVRSAGGGLSTAVDPSRWLQLGPG